MYSIAVVVELFGVERVFDVPIECPATRERGCEGSGQISRYKPDKNNKTHHAIRYKCQECGKQFYGHTSKLFKQFAYKTQVDIAIRLAKCGTRVEMVAEEFDVSTSAASRLVTSFRQYLETKVKKSKSFRIFQNRKKKLGIAGKTVFIDETFRKVNGRQYFLLVAVDGTGQILTWKLSRSRKWHMIRLLFEVLFDIMPEIEVIVTDGFNGYSKALRLLEQSFEVIHIQHIHKHPRGRAIIRIVTRDHAKQICLEYELKSSTQLFAGEDTRFYGQARLKMTKFRLKSLKDSDHYDRAHRLRLKCNQTKWLTKQHKELGLYHSSTKEGDTVYRFPTIPVEIDIEWNKGTSKPDDRPSILINPVVNSAITTMLIPQLTVALMMVSLRFKNKSITSNKIEGVFGNFDLTVPVSGRKSYVPYSQTITSYLYLREYGHNLVKEPDSDLVEMFSSSSIYSVRNLSKAANCSLLR